MKKVIHEIPSMFQSSESHTYFTCNAIWSKFNS